MAYFGKFYLDKEKDIIVELSMEQSGLFTFCALQTMLRET